MEAIGHEAKNRTHEEDTPPKTCPEPARPWARQRRSLE